MAGWEVGVKKYLHDGLLWQQRNLNWDRMDWLVWIVSDVLTWIESPTWGTITLHVAIQAG